MAGGKHIYGMPKGKYIFGTAKVGEKGQIVIPKEVREMFEIEPGDNLMLLADQERGIAIVAFDGMMDFMNESIRQAKEEMGESGR